jgi:hypothetical protein
MYTDKLEEMVSPTSQNTSGPCNQITLIIFYYIISRLVTLLELNGALIQVSYTVCFTLIFKFINFNFQIFPFFYMIHLLASRLTLSKWSTLLQLGSCNYCILAFFLWSKNVNILLQTVTCDTSLRTDLDSH